MAYYKDLREYLSFLKKNDKLRIVEREINKDSELHPLVRWQFRGLPEEQRTGFLFQSLTDSSGKKYHCSVASAVIGASREIYAMGMQCAPEDIHKRWLEAYRRPLEPKLVDSGPVKEVIHWGENLLEHGGLNEFAIPMATNGWEGLPRLTAISWHTRDPDTGVTNIGTYNGYLFGPGLTSCGTAHNAHLRLHLERCRQKGIPLQAAAVIGGVPAVSMVSVTKVPFGLDELAVVGGIAGEPLEVVKCETSDILVPAHAEIVIEGELRADYEIPNPAMGEHLGYMVLHKLLFPFEVKCITHRVDPIWHDYISQMPPSESSTIRGIGSEGSMLNFLKNHCGIPQVKDVAFHHCAGAWRLCVIRLQDIGGVRTHNGTVWQALNASLSISPDWPKIVIAVDEDIDPWDLESVFWAVCFRYQPHRDSRIIQGRTASMDQSSVPYLEEEEVDDRHRFPTSMSGPQGASAQLMDATRKWDYTPVALPKREYMERARKLWEELGYPPLKPQAPWYGYSLGVWPAEYARQAELAEKGKFDQVAEMLLAKARR